MNIKNFNEYQQLNEKIEDDFGREYVSDDDTKEGKYTRDDGWNKKALEEIGLTDWLDRAQAVTYEVMNCRRGSYAIDGETDEDLKRTLESLRDMLDDVINNM